MKKFFCYMLFSLFITVLFILSLNIKVEDIYAAEVYPFNGIIHADSLVIYETNNSASTKKTELAYGTRVTVTRSISNLKNNGCSLYEINYDGIVGYACSSYITNVDSNVSTVDLPGVEPYQNYCTTLQNNGFHESYCPYLYYLHAKHPKWIFKPDFVSDSIEEASNNEQGYVVLQTTNQNYWYRTSPAESDYYYIKNSVITSFMDPRNSLFEKTIFQFLDVISSRYSYNDKAMSSMAGSGNLKKFLTTYQDAGSTYGINPLHLLARSKQEGANNPDYNSVNGQYTTKMSYTYNGNTLDGYYNFYNINATPGNGLGSIGNGLAYAAGYVGVNYDKDGSLTYLRKWDTPQKAILGGGKFIFDAYVQKGQNTTYFEKFNVSSYSTTTRYTHQYMTNIYAPASESVSLYNSYIAGDLADSEFTFIIPVYNDMKSDIYQPVDKSGDNLLTSIMLDGTPIVGFEKDVNEYPIVFSTNNDYVDVSAIASNSKATVTGVGKINFIDDIANTSIIVVAENGSINSYSLKVKRVSSGNVEQPEKNISVADIVGKMGVKVNDSFIYGMSPGMLVTTLNNSVVSSEGRARITDSSGKEKNSVTLSTGDKITIYGTKEEKTYTIAIRGDVNGDGNINISDFVLIQSHILKKLSLSGEKVYAADVNYDGNINISDFVLVQSHILKKLEL